MVTEKKKRLNQFDNSDVEIISMVCLYKGFMQLKSYQFQHKLFSGQKSTIIQRELVQQKMGVAVLPYDAHRDTLILIEQIRIGAIVMPDNMTPWLLEIIAGMIEFGETVEEVARRETMEESGLVISNLQMILRYFSSPGITNELLHIMVGAVDSKKAAGVYGLAEEGEDIRVHVFTRQEAYKLVETGIINNAASIIAIQWLMLHHHQLRMMWLK